MPDISDNTNWNELDGGNISAPPNGWPEGQMPSTVNDCARANMGALKRFWDRVNPVQRITPSGAAWQFNTANTSYPTAYVDGEVYSFWPNAGGAGGDTFQVNSLGAKPIIKLHYGSPTGWSAVSSGDIAASNPAVLVYDSAANSGAGAFWLTNPWVAAGGDGAGGINVPGGLTVGGGASIAGDAVIGGSMSLAGNSYVTGTSYSTGPFFSSGPGAGLEFSARDDTSQDWLWYATGGSARLWMGTDLAVIGTDGSMMLAGSYLRLANNAGGAVNAAGGPLVYADIGNMVFKLGPNNGYWAWQDYTGTVMPAQLDHLGNFTVNANLTARGSYVFIGQGNGALFADANNMMAKIPGAAGAFYVQNSAGTANVGVIDSSGNLTLQGIAYVKSVLINGTDHYIYDGGGGALNFRVGPSGGPDAYFAMKSTGEFDAPGVISAAGLTVTNNINASGTITAAGFLSNGAATGYGFYARDDATSEWFWYANGGTARLWHNGGDLLTLSTSGNLNLSGAVTAVNVTATTNLYVNGCQIYNNGGWTTSPQGFRAGANGFYADSGDLGIASGNGTIAGGLTLNGGGTALYVPNGNGYIQNLQGANDIAAAGVFRRNTPVGTPKGARIECYGGDWDSMQFAIGSGTLYFSPDGGGSGVYVVPGGGFSDARLKTSIRDTQVDALAAILATPVRAFKWNKEGRKLMPHAEPAVPIGLVAQELEETMPGTVGTAELGGGWRHLLDQQITPYLVRALQQLAARVQALESRRA